MLICAYDCGQGPVTLQRMVIIMRDVLLRAENLVERLSTPRYKSEDIDVAKLVTSVAVLPRGGGSCSYLSIDALPDMQNLLQLVKDAVIIFDLAANKAMPF